MSALDSLYKNAERGILREIDKMQLKSYNQDSLYSNVPAWMVYVMAFTPGNSTFTEIVSSGKLQFFKTINAQLDELISLIDKELLIE